MEYILSHISRRGIILATLLPIKLETHDNISSNSPIEQEILSEKEKDDGLKRVRDIFTVDEFDNISPELTTVIQGSILGLFTGFLIGGVNRSKVAYLDFITKNQATQFKSHYDAKKKLQDQVTLGMARGGFQWGWRLGYFTGTYILISSVVAAYRGKAGILEHVVGGMITGGLYKSSLGLRGVAVGGGLGAVLGGIAGTCSYGLLKISGYSMEEILLHRKQIQESRKRVVNESLAPYGSLTDDPLIKDYMERHGSSDILPPNDG